MVFGHTDRAGAGDVAKCLADSTGRRRVPDGVSRGLGFPGATTVWRRNIGIANMVRASDGGDGCRVYLQSASQTDNTSLCFCLSVDDVGVAF